MAKVLSKYSKTNNLQVDYTSQIEYVEALRKKQTNNPPPDDFRTPYTFKDWLDRNVGIIPGEEYKQYNEYLKNWYRGRYTPTDAAKNLRNEYLVLLRELSIAFQTEEDFDFFADINLDDNIELADAIPFFSRKLKEVGIYLINKRDAIKKAKLKYNMSGARNALEKLFYEYLLKAFTKRDYVLNVPEQSAWDSFPELSAVTDNFQIVVQELYDDQVYFDHDPTMPASAYYDTSDPSVTAYFDRIGFTLDNLDWLYQTGYNNLCADHELIWQEPGSLLGLLPLEFEAFDGKKLNDYNRIALTEKYIGEEQYIISGGYWIVKEDTFTYKLQNGNTWFYWPSGEYVNEITDETFNSIALTATNLIADGATAAEKYEDADKIFVQTCNGLSGAWLKNEGVITEGVTMSANIPERDNSLNNPDCKPVLFKFPYPGFGIKGEGIEWTGKQLSNLDPTFNYFDDKLQEEIINDYWTDTSRASSIKGVNIYESQLIDNGAYAAKEFHEADKIYVRKSTNEDQVHDSNPDEVYKDGFNRAWLYKMEKTDIVLPIYKSYIYWPMITYNQNDNLPIKIGIEQCAPIALSSVNVEEHFVGSRCGFGILDSDIIYKLDSPNGYPIECAFLSGKDLGNYYNTTVTANASGKIQPSFTLRCRPGSYEEFIWTDDPIEINNTTINHKEHQKDCLYLQADHDSIFETRGKTLEELNTGGIGNWQTCTCKAINYSPIGHPGNSYDEYDKMADIIFTDTSFPSGFDINTWKGTDGLPYNQSQDFAWFQLSGSQVEPDVGWGSGRWKTGAGTYNFTLSSGVKYNFLRANLRRNPDDIFIKSVPELFIRQKHVNVPSSTWMKATLQDDGTWLPNTDISDMSLDPDNYYVYDHTDTNWYCLTSIGSYRQTVTFIPSAENFIPGTTVSNPWVNVSWTTPDKDIKCNWPNKFVSFGPTILGNELTAIDWSVITPEGSSYNGINYDPSETFSFNACSIGTFSVTAVGYAPTRFETVVIPSVTCSNFFATSAYTGSLDQRTIYNDRIPVVINIPLSGWNYSTNSYDTTSLGGRPFWAEASDANTSQTKFKGNMVWGGGIRFPIDDHTFMTQPRVSQILLSSDATIEYYHLGSGFTWIEPLEITFDKSATEWKKIIIEDSVVSPLSAYLFNISAEMIISATDINSDIILDKTTNGTFVNYWTNNAFTWTQKLTDTTTGIPPSGGRWIPPVSSIITDPVYPFANLTNRHFPTIASMPYIGKLYSDEDNGGYFVPKMLGAGTYIGINYDNILDISEISQVESQRGLTATFRDPDSYISDRGLSKKTQVTPLSTDVIDARWMKGKITESFKAGNIIDAKSYQEFIPYQTRYETDGINYDGLVFQNDNYTPWTGDEDNEWTDSVGFPPNFRGENTILKWYEDLYTPEDEYIYQWKTDIFGNQYVLLKSKVEGQSQYDAQIATGEIYTRDLKGTINPASVSLSAVYDDFIFRSPTISADLANNNIKDFDIWYDTLMIQTSSNILIEKLNFDYDENRIFSIADDIHIIDLSANNNGKFGGMWLFDEKKKVTLCNIVSGEYIYPQIRNLDLDTNKLTKTLDGSGNNLLFELSTVNLTSFEEPVFTYNSLTKVFNISFIGYSSTYSGPLITTMYIQDLDDTHEIKTVKTITPRI